MDLDENQVDVIFGKCGRMANARKEVPIDTFGRIFARVVESSSCACEVSIETYAAFAGSKTVVSKSNQIGTICSIADALSIRPAHLC